MKRRNSTLNERLRHEAADLKLFDLAREYAVDYMRSVENMPVYPGTNAIAALNVFRGALPENGGDPYNILETLHRYGSPATVAQTGGRYFGFVTGGILPASLATRWLADTWDQNAAMYVSSPVASVLEEVCEGWLVELLGLKSGTAAGFVGGSSSALLCGLAAARNSLLARAGYDVGAKGLFGAPEIRVILGEGAHSSVYKALAILGLGSGRIIRIPQDEHGRIRTEDVPELDGKTLLILQAGNVNTGAFDDFKTLCTKARGAGAWVHIDGAFGLWAAASNKLRHLTDGAAQAHSWSLDAHKTLNTPYDCGVILCEDKNALLGALRMSGSYIVYSDNRDGMLYTPDMSRRARAIDLWAALMSLGRRGVAEITEELHDKAAYFADQLAQNDFSIHNTVFFNQVLVSADTPEITADTLKRVQDSGICWCGGSLWQGKPVIRISVCSYRTRYEDIDCSVNAFVKAREQARHPVG